ncbi:hypothetical protein [Celeribacter ethanolicus]|uniref:hypothetical protein n=1 Tax=Celeribacter ethanolicus TaxID=1758178 RepID=UPI0012FE7BD4|nr:hypothetical protein [Celeribacter ethanolicus]
MGFAYAIGLSAVLASSGVLLVYLANSGIFPLIGFAFLLWSLKERLSIIGKSPWLILVPIVVTLAAALLYLIYLWIYLDHTGIPCSGCKWQDEPTILRLGANFGLSILAIASWIALIAICMFSTSINQTRNNGGTK